MIYTFELKCSTLYNQKKPSKIKRQIANWENTTFLTKDQHSFL